MLRNSAIGVLLIDLFGFNAICSQNDPKYGKIFSVRTNLLVVNDKDELASGIKQSDIKLYENGVEQKITEFNGVPAAD